MITQPKTMLRFPNPVDRTMREFGVLFRDSEFHELVRSVTYAFEELEPLDPSHGEPESAYRCGEVATRVLNPRP